MTPEHERYVWLRDGNSAYGRDCERVKFISFLQAIQDAHDSAFDAFHDTPQPMPIGNL